MKFFIVITASLLCFLNFSLGAKTKEKSVTCDGLILQKVKVALGRVTMINFPVKPKDVVAGSSLFDFKQIKDDLAIKALRSNGRTNVFVYMQERRCGFDLVTVSSGGDDIVYVRDPKELQMEVKAYE